MKIRYRDLVPAGLAILGALALSGCNSPSTTAGSSSASTTSSTTQTKSSTSSTSSSDGSTVEAKDGAVAPQRKPPAGMGNAIGRVLFDGKGAPNIEVSLCENIGLIGGCEGKTYQGKTDAKGFYIIDKVKPGPYSLAVRIFNTNNFLYPTSGIMSAAKYEVKADESLPVRTVNLWKTDVQTISPTGTVNTDKPKFAWKAYPHATSYKVGIRTKGNAGTQETIDAQQASAMPDKPLLNGDYEWHVEAFNADGTKLAETPKDSTFAVVGQKGSNMVELVSPKPSVSIPGTGVTLLWKAHPLADSYHVYLSGAGAKEPLVNYESVTATSYKVPNVLPPNRYFWTVDAYKGSDKVAGSAFVSFNVK